MTEPAVDDPPGALRPRRPWAWVPSIYFIQGLPYSIVNKLAPVLYKDLGVSNADITFWVGWLSVLWAFKALWSPFIDTLSTKRRWVVAMQGAMVPTLSLLAFTLPTPFFFNASLALFLLVAFSSATYDVAADGFYMLGLRTDQQSAFVGVRSTFWRGGLIAAESGMVMLAGVLAIRTSVVEAWTATLLAAAGLFLVATVFHAMVLPYPVEDVPRPRHANVGTEWLKVFAEFFRKDGIVAAVLFLLFYRFAENMMLSLVAPFLKDPIVDGGLGLDNIQFGFAKGLIGVVAMLVGGILGGLAVYQHGLRAWLWPMVAIIHLPDLVFVYLSWVQPTSFAQICVLLGIEQFGYGFGFTAYMMFMMNFAAGEHKTAHYAIATGIMALAVTLTSIWTGALQEVIGYRWFFVCVAVSTIPSALVTALVRIPPEFGKRQTA